MSCACGATAETFLTFYEGKPLTHVFVEGSAVDLSSATQATLVIADEESGVVVLTALLTLGEMAVTTDSVSGAVVALDSTALGTVPPRRPVLWDVWLTGVPGLESAPVASGIGDILPPVGT